MTPKAAVHTRMPDERCSITHKFNVSGHEGYVTVGFYKEPKEVERGWSEESKIGEVFITVSKQGSTVSGLLDCLGIAVSAALQRGIDVDVFYDKFIGQRFEPMGHSSNPEIGQANSIVDYIFRWMRHRFNPELVPKLEGEK